MYATGADGSVTTRIRKHVGRVIVAATGAVVLVSGVAGCSSGSKHSGPSATPKTPNTSSANTSSPSATTEAIPALKVVRSLSTTAVLLRYALGSVWAVTPDAALLRLGTDGKQLGEPLRTGVMDVKFDGHLAYVLTTSSVEQFDPSTGRVSDVHRVSDPVAFDVRGGTAYVEVGPADGTQGDGAVEAVDMASGSTRKFVLTQALSDNERADGVAVDPTGSVWAIDANTLLELKATSLQSEGTFALPFEATELRALPSGVFVATQEPGGGIVRLLPGAKAVSPCWPDGDALQMVPDGTRLWVSAAAGLTELDQQTCRPLGQAAPLDQSGGGIAVLPHEVWAAFVESHEVQVVDTA